MYDGAMKPQSFAVAAVVVGALVRPAVADAPFIPITVKASSEAKDTPSSGALFTTISNMNGTKWCPSNGDGTGEAVTFTFETPIALSAIQLRAGVYKPMPTYNYPSKLEVTAGKQQLAIDVTTRGENVNVKLDGSAVDAVTIKIAAVGPGKPGDACISMLKFQSATEGEFYAPFPGIDQAGLDALPAYAAGLDAAFKACDAAVLGTAVAFPLAHDHVVVGSDQSEKHKRVKYKSVKPLVAACKKKGSFLKLGFGSGEKIDERWDLAHPRSKQPGEILLGSADQGGGWVVRWKDGAWGLTEVRTVK